MKDLGKINSKQVYGLWRNLSVCIVAVTATLVFSKILPYYLSPVVALLIAAALYMYIYNEKLSVSKSCILPPISILYSIVIYAFFTIILNLMHIWGLFEMPHEFIFFTDPFIPALILNPISCIVISLVWLEHRKLSMCIECKSGLSMGIHRGANGILNNEVHIQIKNFIIMSGVLSLAVWAYYQFAYINVNINGRDDYIFTWLTVIGAALDWIYFSWRYYNLYLDLKEHDELISPSELRDMTSKTYIRYYVICGNYMYLTPHAKEPGIEHNEVWDTPFFTKQNMNDVFGVDVKKTVEEMTGVDNGELRFFFGRKSPVDNKHSLLRYFYFLDGDISDYPELSANGEWVPFDKVIYLYSNFPQKMAELALYDITRLATIVLTAKIFDEEGYRKSRIKSYNPSFNLPEVRRSNLDFQDDKWIQVSLFNSDTPMFKLKKWWRQKTQNTRKKTR
ncbi:MAG: hypothetical protein J1F16_07000 [Muribaculaceae bacterium]|nr:hypothetical protein [Muribaculaceae bacterium]